MKYLKLTFFTLLLASAWPGTAQAVNLMHPAPVGWDAYLTMMQNGEFDPATPNPDVPGCFQFFCDGDFFQTEVMQRTPGETAAVEQDAKMFFLTRFGIDVDAPDLAGRIFFRSFYQDPRVNQRVYAMSDRIVPTSGWKVRDGGFIIFLLDPNGVELGGEFDGQVAPAGTFLVYGEYNIAARKPGPPSEIVISYRSGSLVGTSNVNSLTSFSCELHSGRIDSFPGWGDLSEPAQGRAIGVVDIPIVTPTGLLRSSYRNQLTFNSDGGY